ncbi:MAG TPA: hypothetical protein P5528_00920 [Steroidobacteraceae bacterium]|nr:hypothetical protein [Steroidobacteraceae bacterium]HRX87980.1 hypothetical protein [Steroidobacteraceae bacterium]
MTEKSDGKRAPTPEVTRTQPAAEPIPPLSRAEKIFTRLTLWQTVLSVASVVVAVIALYAALTESAAVRKQTAAGVWPFVQLSIDTFDSADSASFTLALRNVGVGPARIRGVRLLLGGEAIHDWAHAVRKLGASPTSEVTRNFVTDRVLSRDERVIMIGTHVPDLARRFQAALADPANSITFCYCSIFDDCWLADSSQDLQNPKSVESCPDFGAESYRN